jgi:hypothetical protein
MSGNVQKNSTSTILQNPPEDLGGWIKMKMAGSRQRRWEEGKNVMKERKKNICWQNGNE